MNGDRFMVLIKKTSIINVSKSEYIVKDLVEMLSLGAFTLT
jgi:hypothetical protein